MEVYVVIDHSDSEVELVTTDKEKAKDKARELKSYGFDPEIKIREVIE